MSLANEGRGSKVIVQKDLQGPESFKVYIKGVCHAPGTEILYDYRRTITVECEAWSLPVVIIYVCLCDILFVRQ